jgi:hypothetical protein
MTLTQEQIQLIQSLKGEVDKIKVNLILENKKLDQIANLLLKVMNGDYNEKNSNNSTSS